jgi:AraC-like DNA-binding protein
VRPVGRKTILRKAHCVEGAFEAGDLVREAVQQVLSEAAPAQKLRQRLSGTFDGWFWVEDVSPGLFASACDLMSPSGAAISQPVERSAMITLLLEGENGRFEAEGTAPVSSKLERAHVIGLGEPRLCTRVLSAGQACKRIEIGVKPAFIEANQAALSQTDLEALDRLLAPGFRSHDLPRSETMVQLASMLAEDRYHGSLGALFRESIAVQVMLQSLRLFRQGAEFRAALGPRCYEAVMEARHLLDCALLSPPGTVELARRVGLNRNTLQAGFKAAFGTTVFGYVRDARMAMARIMIEEQGLGAAEAGYKVGFASPSAFSAAYRRKFGRSPMRLGLTTQA